MIFRITPLDFSLKFLLVGEPDKGLPAPPPYGKVMVIFMILNLFRFKKNMSSRTKIHRTVFFGAISITRFSAFLGIFANFRKIANHYFSKFLSKYWSDGKSKYGLSYSKFDEDFKNSNGNITWRHLDVIMTSSSWHFCHILINFYKISL